MNTISIIGRANVGKSTLFNRLAGKKQAMISDIPGTTRDLKYTEIQWQGDQFELIDTGGFLAGQKPLRDMTRRQEKKFKGESVDDVDKQVEFQAKIALIKSKVVLFVVDAREGLNPQDRQIADYLRKTKNKKIILVVNKCDSPKIREMTAEFYKLGLGNPLLVSAVNGSGTGDLLDEIIKKLDDSDLSSSVDPSRPINVIIIGKPNVGKSSLANSFAGEKKAIVSPVAQTTREPNDTLIEFEQKKIVITDTAGIRRKANVARQTLEELGVKMTISALKKSDIALLLLDISKNITKQDLILGRLLTKYSAGVIIVANKYDLLKNQGEDNENLTKEYTQYIYRHFPHLSWSPIIFTSAKTGFNVQKILKLILVVEDRKQIKIPAGALNKFLKTIIQHQPPPKKQIGDSTRTKLKRAFITHLEQIDTRPPTFSCIIGSQEKLPEEYRKYIINNLRKKFGFHGVPIKLAVKWSK
ncbi:ribosome biogenesis GTPase Der [Candidatus Kuenenbacteria bacterium CG11_big_fil_rev_8_21_14_0_20_37_9]|uniref:GTPase Der n=2 Tax=Candidatus Kueneniibacteriota TaxID=1752740 RepID=A0A2M6XTL9_9BACT|nr:MAG: ribosome biogenesis GTPase Der [Candidatus Kuenenbacteria bacterium CG1_02_38_13]PIR05918.1 MAG: ribosome biogenesis GTPase Der [Candidatus Kuenenbacteria bacterium CG11_big_fil_rev_8_21_14_0_20_37_9]PIU10986.1 MAG: ribosome biogenesis GTPase Der [Candidatus Kuenenbacteria bacterium CG08_land_8_20_14_0_20_37_23]